MKKVVSPLIFFVLLISLSGCASDEVGGVLATPTAIPLYTPAPAVGETIETEAEPAAEDEDMDEPEVLVEATPVPTVAIVVVEPTATEMTETADEAGVATVETEAPEGNDAVTGLEELVEDEDADTGTAVVPVETEAPAEDEANTGLDELVETETPESAEAEATPNVVSTPRVIAAATSASPDHAGAADDATVADEVDDLPEDFVTELAEADPENGAQLVVSTGCTACHSLEEGVRLVGPSWYSLATHAAEHVEGQSATEYLYFSIVHPNDYLVESYPANVMPQNYEDLLSTEAIADMVAYLLTLSEE